MDSDLDLDLILSTGWVGFQICECLWIWIRFRIQYCPWVGSVFKSVKSYGFGFGVGFTLGHRLDWIMDLFFCLDLDSGYDSFFFSNMNLNL